MTTPQHGIYARLLAGGVTICAYCRRHVNATGGACPTVGAVYA